MKQDRKQSKYRYVVSCDKDWIHRVSNQKQLQYKWEDNWGGFMSYVYNPEKYQVLTNVNCKIKELEREINQLDGNVYGLTSGIYGRGNKLQMFDNSKYNIRQNRELKSLERKLPKGWKKQKWTPTDDPFDPLSKIYKKKK